MESSELTHVPRSWVSRLVSRSSAVLSPPPLTAGMSLKMRCLNALVPGHRLASGSPFWKARGLTHCQVACTTCALEIPRPLPNSHAPAPSANAVSAPEAAESRPEMAKL